MTALFKGSMVQTFNVFREQNAINYLEVCMAVKLFEDLEIWKEARRLTQRIYQLTKNEIFPKILF